MKHKAGRKNSALKKARIPGVSAGSHAHRTGGDRGSSAAADPPGAREGGSVPPKYGYNSVILMARDPYWCYAFWDISNPFMEKKKKELGQDWQNARLCLRIYDVTGAGAAVRQQDIAMNDAVGNIYINIWSPAHVYQAEAGLLTDSGRFAALAISNRIEAPPDSAVEDAGEVWKADKEDLREILKMPADENTGVNYGPRTAHRTGNASPEGQDDKGGRS
jgi:uncharacterized protein